MQLNELKIKLTKLRDTINALRKKLEEVLVAQKDTWRGAEIYQNEDRFQVIPMIPTLKGG